MIKIKNNIAQFIRNILDHNKLQNAYFIAYNKRRTRSETKNNIYNENAWKEAKQDISGLIIQYGRKVLEKQNLVETLLDYEITAKAFAFIAPISFKESIQGLNQRLKKLVQEMYKEHPILKEEGINLPIYHL